MIGGDESVTEFVLCMKNRPQTSLFVLASLFCLESLLTICLQVELLFDSK